MKIKCTEYHTVARIMHYNIDDDIFENDWEGTKEDFFEAIADCGHPRYDEATDLMYQYGHDEEEEDWISDRKGGYDVEWTSADDN